MTKKRNIMAVAIAASIGLISNGVLAEKKSSSGFMLEEVMVTARKREEGLQDAPISITAFSGDGLEQRNITNISDIGNITPNLIFNTNAPLSGSSASANIFIRGVGQLDYTLVTEPGVGLYIDGVYVARSVGQALDLIDVERIEVLRGPQGTLFGRNTIGGAVSLTSKKPNDELGGSLEITVGDDERRDVRGKINVPFTDNFMGSLSLSSKKRDGYIDRPLASGGALGDDDALSGRVALLWLPTDDVEVYFNVDATRQRENGAASTLVHTDPNQLQVFILNGANVPGLGNFGAPPFNAAPCAGTTCWNSQWLGGEFESKGTFPSVSELDLWGASLAVSWNISEEIQFKSITALRDMDSLFSRDSDHSPLLLDHTYNEFEQEQFSQEFQLLGNYEKAHWVVGAYIFSEEGTDVNIVDFPIAKLHSGGSVENESNAFFGQLTYDFTEKLNATFGLRYTKEEKEFLPDQYLLDPKAGLSWSNRSSRPS